MAVDDMGDALEKKQDFFSSASTTDERRQESQENNMGVDGGGSYNLLRRAKRCEQGRQGEECQRRQSQGENAAEDGGGEKLPPKGGMLPGAAGLREKDADSAAAAADQKQKEIHNRTGQTCGGERLVSHAAPDDRHVDRAAELLQVSPASSGGARAVICRRMEPRVRSAVEVIVPSPPVYSRISVYRQS